MKDPHYHRNTHPHPRTHTRTHTHTHTHTRTDTRNRTQTETNTLTRTHLQTHKHTQTDRHTHAHTHCLLCVWPSMMQPDPHHRGPREGLKDVPTCPPSICSSSSAALNSAGSTCQLQIDKCQSQPCLNGGGCHDTNQSFACTCPPGFHGDRCECQSGPCQDGGPCLEGLSVDG